MTDNAKPTIASELGEAVDDLLSTADKVQRCAIAAINGLASAPQEPDGSKLFDLLEGLKSAWRAVDPAKADAIAAGFARATGGVDVEWLIAQLGPDDDALNIEQSAIYAWEAASPHMVGCFRLWNEVPEKEKDEWRTIVRAVLQAPEIGE